MGLRIRLCRVDAEGLSKRLPVDNFTGPERRGGYRIILIRNSCSVIICDICYVIDGLYMLGIVNDPWKPLLLVSAEHHLDWGEQDPEI
jgi:hypothetical protein